MLSEERRSLSGRWKGAYGSRVHISFIWLLLGTVLYLMGDEELSSLWLMVLQRSDQLCLRDVVSDDVEGSFWSEASFPFAPEVLHTVPLYLHPGLTCTPLDLRFDPEMWRP